MPFGSSGLSEIHTAFIGLGSNIGDRSSFLLRGLEAMDRGPDISVSAVSDFVETEPVGGPPGQPSFLNAACRVATSLSPEALLSRLLAIEAACGRIRKERWGPRTLDLDILIFDDMVLHTPDLKIPHPLMQSRTFVLRPLAQIAPGLRHPVSGKTISELLAALEEQA